MDVLTDVIATMRMGEPHSRLVRHSQPFSSRFPAIAAAGFHVMLSGSCWFHSADGTALRLNEGDFTLLVGGSPHGLSGGTEDREHGSIQRSALLQGAEPATRIVSSGGVMLCGAYLLDRSRPHPLLLQLPDVFVIPTARAANAALRGAIELLRHELSAAHAGGTAAVGVLIDLLLIYALRAWVDEHGRDAMTGGWAAALTDPGIARALEAIHEAPGSAWSVATLADHAAMSRSAFAKRFTELVGQPPISYLAWWRMTLAARKLRAGGTSLAELSLHLGYATEFAFSHAFKRAHGVPPGRFRASLRASLESVHAEQAKPGAPEGAPETDPKTGMI